MEPVPLVRVACAAFARRDGDALIELTDPAVEFHAPTAAVTQGGEPYRGHAGLRRYLADVGALYDRLDLELDDVRAVDAERVLALGRVRVHGAGRAIDAPAGWLWTVRAGRVVRVEVFETRQAALDAAAAG